MERNLPGWARRLRREREVRGWSQADVADRLIALGDRQTPARESVRRHYRGWEVGGHLPSAKNQEQLARVFDTVSGALFPPDRPGQSALAAATDTVEISTRIRGSDIDSATLEGLGVTVEQLCSEYATTPADRLIVNSRDWLQRVTELRHARLTLAQHREVLALTGWLALLVGCLEHDLERPNQAEVTRRTALTLGVEAGHAQIQGWAHEMRSWFALTGHDYRGAIAAAQAGANAAAGHGVAVQLEAQQAKAWARLGERREVDAALDRGARLLERLPYPDNIANHFVVDPGKYDFYRMDAYRALAEDRQATLLADEVMRTGTDATGVESNPMRCAEARITLAVAAARRGDLDQAVDLGIESLSGERKSVPALRTVSSELVNVLTNHRPNEQRTRDYLERWRTLGT